MWTCAHCGTTNPIDGATCLVCSAPAHRSGPTVPPPGPTVPPAGPIVPVADVTTHLPTGPHAPPSPNAGPWTIPPSPSPGSPVVGATPPERTPWLALAAIAVIALLCGVIAFLLVRPGGGGDRTDAGQPDSETEPVIDPVERSDDEPDTARRPEAVPIPTAAPTTPEPTRPAPPAPAPAASAELSPAPYDSWMLVLESLDKSTVSLGEAVEQRDRLRASEPYIDLFDSNGTPHARDGYWIVGLAPFGSRSAATDSCSRVGRSPGDRCYPLHTGTGER